MLQAAQLPESVLAQVLGYQRGADVVRMLAACRFFRALDAGPGVWAGVCAALLLDEAAPMSSIALRELQAWCSTEVGARVLAPDLAASFAARACLDFKLEDWGGLRARPFARQLALALAGSGRLQMAFSSSRCYREYAEDSARGCGGLGRIVVHSDFKLDGAHIVFGARVGIILREGCLTWDSDAAAEVTWPALGGGPCERSRLLAWKERWSELPGAPGFVCEERRHASDANALAALAPLFAPGARTGELAPAESAQLLWRLLAAPLRWLELPCGGSLPGMGWDEGMYCFLRNAFVKCVTSEPAAAGNAFDFVPLDATPPSEWQGSHIW